MSQPLTKQLDELELLERKMLRDVLDELITEDNGLFRVEGSLLDHTLDEWGAIIDVRRSGGRFNYEIDFEWPVGFDEDHYESEKGRVRDSFLRAGVARPTNVGNAMAKLRQYDDVVIGIDTNVLLDCVFTAHLLDEVYKERFPNWILIAIPKLVMAEIENSANQKIGSKEHPRHGWPGYRGRIGNRALQEIMALDSKDGERPGMSIMTIGELGFDSAEFAKTRNWLLDSEIRQQFQAFLNDISFHKGTYFLSQDRVNVMMSGTEGADGLYLQKPEIDDFESGSLTLDKLGQIIYELCIQFGEVRISNIGDDDHEVRFRVFWPGKHVSDWRKSRVRLEKIEVPPW